MLSQKRSPYILALDKATRCFQSCDRELYQMNLKQGRNPRLNQFAYQEQMNVCQREKERLREILMVLEIGPKTILEFTRFMNTAFNPLSNEIDRIERSQDMRVRRNMLSHFDETNDFLVERMAYMNI